MSAYLFTHLCQIKKMLDAVLSALKLFLLFFFVDMFI